MILYASGIKFYRFPTDPERRRKWIAAVRRENWMPTAYTWICSQHFITGEKSNNPLAPNYVPSVFEYVSSPAKRRLENDLDRFQRRQAMKRRRSAVAACNVTVDEVGVNGNEDGVFTSCSNASNNVSAANSCTDVEETDVVPVNSEQDGELEETFVHTVNPSVDEYQEKISEATKRLSQVEALLGEKAEELSQVKSQLSVTSNQLEETKAELEKMQKANTQLRSENSSFSKKVISDEFLRNDDKAVKYYTGLPSYELLKAIYDLVSMDLPSSLFSGCACSPFQQFLIVLIKLRLAIGDQDLAYRFGIHQSTVSRYFNKWLDILYRKLSVFVSWPEREQLLKTMPADFRKNFGKCVIVIDCFEVFIERPTSLMARAQTWSNYKKHNTVKFLIGITPQRTIAFISNGWGGRASDVYITEHSGLLRHLLPGDIVLADRGFNIQEAAGMYCAEVKVPPYTKGKKQLSQMEVDVARRLSRVRIHVERVIGMVRQKYTILQSTLPINMIMCHDHVDSEVSTVDKIVTVACSLCNHCDSVIPFD